MSHGFKYYGYLLIAFLLFVLSPAILPAQDHYQQAWELLKAGNLTSAADLFEKAKKNKQTSEKSALALTLLYERLNQPEKASEAFMTFFENSNDPYPEIYALFFNEGVTGSRSLKKEPYQVALLDKIKKDDRSKGKLDVSIDYALGLHHVFSNKSDKAAKAFAKVNNIRDWLFVGPFDNVMNSGFDKDFGVLAHPESNSKFQSKYGSEVSWFDPPYHAEDGYTSKEMYFYSSNSIIYAQTFVESQKDQEIILKFGYSGSLKLWLNDALVYSESAKRQTEMDYFQYRVSLNKGYNRILVQLGEHQESYPNFSIRFTDLDHNSIKLPNTNTVQNYQKSANNSEQIPFYAIESLKKKIAVEPGEILYQLLLLKAYMRSHELDKGENILKEALNLDPDNFFVLREAVLFYEKVGNGTEQARYYELFSSKYPKSRDLLYNEIEEHFENKNKTKASQLVKEYLDRYHTPEMEFYFKIGMASLNEEYNKVISYSDQFYKEYPDSYYAVVTKYNLEKSMQADPVKSNKILENYLKNNYSYLIIETLAKNFLEEGKWEKAIQQLKRGLISTDFDLKIFRQLVNIYYRQSKYDRAIAICESIKNNIPSDYRNLKDLALLHKLNGDKEHALNNSEQALSYYPFSFETNENIRELKGLKSSFDLIPSKDPKAIIEDFETNFVPKTKESYDIVYDSKAKIIFKSMSEGFNRKYILKINDESAIQEWQRMDFSPAANMEIILNDAQIIKTNGNKIDGERHDNEVVYTNLEIGDYIFVHFTQKQISGGKSSLFISDRFTFNSYFPTFIKEYFVLAEDGVSINYKMLNFDQAPQQKQLDGCTLYSWIINKPPVLKSEPYTFPFNDITQSLHISVDKTWYDIAQWYSDLTNHQATPDYTIQQIARELFEGKTYSQEEKARIIYDFVCKNIQYSSIDFRQSSYIPQKASDTYHSRLGDCKDISTLYAAIGRETGLDIDLVLINTRNNGHNDVLLPSLNFNHCIVKVNLDGAPNFLELTDPDLPYGHLYYYHDNAAILEIPYGKVPKDIKLTRLKGNSGFKNNITRKAKIVIDEDLKLHSDMEVIKTGSQAASAYETYFEKDEELQKENLLGSLDAFFDSTVKLKSFDFSNFKQREQKASYRYSITVENEVLKVGSFRSIKAPFSDFLATTDILEEEERFYDFDFPFYETTDNYEETIEINLKGSMTWVELPENISLNYKGNSYKLVFEQISDKTLKILRTYSTDLTPIKSEEFSKFKAFVEKLLEAEKTNLVFK